jgi:hypothetical protein
MNEPMFKVDEIVTIKQYEEIYNILANSYMQKYCGKKATIKDVYMNKSRTKHIYRIYQDEWTYNWYEEMFVSKIEPAEYDSEKGWNL